MNRSRRQPMGLAVVLASAPAGAMLTATAGAAQAASRGHRTYKLWGHQLCLERLVQVPIPGRDNAVSSIDFEGRPSNGAVLEPFSQEVGIIVDPGRTAWVAATSPIHRNTGDFILTFGNTTWKLLNSYFDTPDPERSAEFVPDDRALTPPEYEDTCSHLPPGTKGILQDPASWVTLHRVGSSAHDRMVDHSGRTTVRTGIRTGHGRDHVDARDGRSGDTVRCTTSHTVVVSDPGDRLRGRCGKVILTGPAPRHFGPKARG